MTYDKIGAGGHPSGVEENGVWAIARREREQMATLGSLARSVRPEPRDEVDFELTVPITIRSAPRKGGSNRGQVARLKWLHAPKRPEIRDAAGASATSRSMSTAGLEPDDAGPSN